MWAELAAQQDIYAANWAGPGWVQAGLPPPGDEGYQNAFGFSVEAVNMSCSGGSLARLLEQFTFTLWDPAGNEIGAFSTVPNTPLAANVPMGQGIWTVVITEGPGGSGPPLTRLGGATVNEPFVTDSIGDNVIRLQFGGTPIVCPDTVTGTASTPTECTNGMRSVALTVNLSLGGNPLQIPAGTWVEWDWGDSSPSGNLSLTASASTVTSPLHPYAPGNYTPSVTLLLPGGNSCGPYQLPSVNIMACLPCPTDVTVAAQITGCSPGGNPAITLQASVSWPTVGGPFPDPTGFNWEVTTPAGTSASKTTPYQGGPSDTTNMTAGWSGTGTAGGAVDLSQPGNYSVAVTAVFGSDSGIGGDCPLQGSGIFVVPTCTRCPEVSSLEATVTGCVGQDGNPRISFQALLSGAAAASITWTVTNPSGARATQTTLGQSTDSSTANGQWTGQGATSAGALNLSAFGPYTVAMAANVAGSATGCPPSAPTGFTVPQCPQPGQGSGTGGSGGGSFGCAALLITALALLLIGGVLAEIGVCFGIQPLLIAGLVAAGAGLVLFIIWLIFCSADTPCNVMRDIYCLLFWISQVVGIIQTVLTGLLLTVPNPNLLCFVTAIVAYAGWSGILLWYGQIMTKLDCPPRACF